MAEQENFREQRREERRKRREECNTRFRERYMSGDNHSQMTSGGIWTGLFILLLGVAFLLKATVADIPNWVFTWQMLLIALGLFVGIRQAARGGSIFSSLVLILIGGAFLIPEIYPDITIRRYIWPVVLIILGLYFILRNIRRRGGSDDEKGPEVFIKVEGGIAADKTSDSKEDFIHATSVFGGTKKNIISKNFKGGDLVSIFGGTEVDLTRADFNGSATLELTTIFGGTKLIVPSHWEVKSEAAVIFGGIEDKRAVTASPEGAPKRLVLKGTILFGGVDIKSY